MQIILISQMQCSNWKGPYVYSYVYEKIYLTFQSQIILLNESATHPVPLLAYIILEDMHLPCSGKLNNLANYSF